MPDEAYHLLAKYLLESYLEQLKRSAEGEVSGYCGKDSCLEPTVDTLLAEVLSSYYLECLPKLREELKEIRRELLEEVEARLKASDKLNFLRDLPGLMGLNTIFFSLASESGLPISSSKATIYFSVIKLIAYATYYVKVFLDRRRLNGSLQRISQSEERNESMIRELRLVAEKPEEVFRIISELLKSREVREYVIRRPWITERYVYDLALKLRELRERLYGRR